MKFRWITLLFLFVAAAIATTKFAREMVKVRTPGKVTTVSCPALPATCRLEVGGHPLELSFSPAPVLLKPFTLNVKAPAARSVFAEFAMAGMDMGVNRYRLEAAGTGAWKANVTLPVCVAGSSNWIMTLEVDGAKVQVPFTAEK